MVEHNSGGSPEQPHVIVKVTAPERTHLSRAAKIAASVAALAVGATIYSLVPGIPHPEAAAKGGVKSTVTRIEPLDVSYKADYDAVSKGYIEATLVGAGVGGYHCSEKVKTTTLMGARKDGATISTPDASGFQSITIDRSKMRLFTGADEASRDQRCDNNPGLSQVGSSIGGFLDGSSLGLIHLPDISGTQRSELGKELSERIVNNVEQKCGRAVLGTETVTASSLISSQTPQEQANDEPSNQLTLGERAIVQAYREEAVQRGIDQAKVSVTFAGQPDFPETYKSTWHSDVFKISKYEYEPSCTVSATTLSGVDQEGHSYGSTVQPSQAAN